MTPPSTDRRSANLREGRVSVDYAAYVITKVVHERSPVLHCREIAKILTDSWNYLRSVDRIKLFASCIMPDHYHLAFMLMPGETLPRVVEDTNKFTSRRINQALGRTGQLWQAGFHDRNCRTADELHDIGVYIEHNPVRAGLVDLAEQWPYSSAHPESKGMLDREWWPSS